MGKKKVNKQKENNEAASSSSRQRDMIEFIIYVAAVFVIVYLVITYLGQRTVVNGDSMDNTLADGQSLIMDKISYRFRDPKRYEIVIFPGPEDETGVQPYYIKRIIGLPGEKVNIVNSKVYINDEELTTDVYSINGATEDEGDLELPVTLKEDEYFCLGDNRPVSADSRYSEVGPVKRNEFVGKVWIRIWPLTKFGSVN